MRAGSRRQAAVLSQLPTALTNPGVIQLRVESATEALLLTGPGPPCRSEDLTLFIALASRVIIQSMPASCFPAFLPPLKSATMEDAFWCIIYFNYNYILSY